MLLDATVVRSIAVLGWADLLAKAVGGSLHLAHGVMSTEPHERSELRGIRDALQREAQHAQPGSGRQSKAASAVERLDLFLAIGSPTVTVLMPDPEEVAMAIRLSSRDAEQRNWRAQLELTARRLDAGEAVSIAIAAARNLDFASDDEQALIAYTALGHYAPARTRDAIKLLVARGLIDETARARRLSVSPRRRLASARWARLVSRSPCTTGRTDPSEGRISHTAASISAVTWCGQVSGRRGRSASAPRPPSA